MFMACLPRMARICTPLSWEVAQDQAGTGVTRGSSLLSNRLLLGDGIERGEPLLHRLPQVIAGTAKGRVALADEVALLLGPFQRRAMVVRLHAGNRLQEGVVDVAV